MSEAEDRAVVEKLYKAFAAHDGPTMAALYADDATFGDPVFPALRGKEIGDMWTMLTGRDSGLVLELGEITTTPQGAYVAPWIARYTFTNTGRKVENHVTSTIRIENGKIRHQRDSFDFRRWQVQALGLFGSLLGWTGIPGAMVKRMAAKGLARYRATH